MQVLILDADSAIDRPILQYLQARGYEITLTCTPGDVLDLIHRTEFDGILLDVATAECLGLLEIRQLVRTSAVAFMTALPVEALLEEAVAEGSIAFRSVRALIGDLEHLHQPMVLVGAALPPALVWAARQKGLRISTARTLQFAMNLLVDGWCQIVWLHAEMPGRVAQSGSGAIVHQVGAKQLAILASLLSGSTPGITCSRKPEKAAELISLLQRISGSQPVHCGSAEALGKRRHSG